MFYIEFISITTILVGLYYPPNIAFLFLLIVPLILNTLKQFIKPSDDGGSFFFPSFSNFLDGALASVVYFMKGQGLLTIMILLLIVKLPINMWYDRMSDPSKPFAINVLFQIIFNLAIASFLADWTLFAVA